MWRALWLCVLSTATVGCFFTRSERPLNGEDDRSRVSAESVVRSIAPITPAEGIFLESIILERPIGDPFLDQELWNAVLPVGSPETRVLLSENGLRAGVLATQLPQKFQTLLKSETEAIHGRGLTFANRKEDVLPTSGPYAKCEFHLFGDLGGKRTSVSLQDARCGILVRPEATTDGRVKLFCEPQIQHGQKQEWFRPVSDITTLTRVEEVPLARYTQLAFEAQLGSNEYLLIGWQAEQADTIGEVLFGVEASGQPRQRVLVIRVRQLKPNTPHDLPPIPNRRPSIAAEAGRTSR